MLMQTDKVKQAELELAEVAELLADKKQALIEARKEAEQQEYFVNATGFIYPIKRDQEIFTKHYNNWPNKSQAIFIAAQTRIQNLLWNVVLRGGESGMRVDRTEQWVIKGLWNGNYEIHRLGGGGYYFPGVVYFNNKALARSAIRLLKKVAGSTSTILRDFK